jgi:hypothetical protein
MGFGGGLQIEQPIIGINVYLPQFGHRSGDGVRIWL